MIVSIDYHLDNDNPWQVSEKTFNENHLAKFESIFAQGNGRLGIRASLEEPYVKETRNTFLSGTFNIPEENEVAELPNLMDVTRFDIVLDGVPFSLLKGDCDNYRRTLDLRTGEIRREFIWRSENNKRYAFTFRRFVSMADKELVAQRVEIRPLDARAKLQVVTGIDGRQTNSGAQHLKDMGRRYRDGDILQYYAQTNQSNLDIVASTGLRVRKDQGSHVPEASFRFGRRKAQFSHETDIRKDDVFVLEKLSTFLASSDAKLQGEDREGIAVFSADRTKELLSKDYEEHLAKSVWAWERIWNKQDVRLISRDPFDQLALRFAIYHLNIMTPRHDSRQNIGAKGLSGEGYKGHTFWDTEIFILPFWICTEPGTARSLLTYRYHGLAGARKKAKENGYKGAMFPWESARPEDGEMTPSEGGTDIHTGKPIPIITGEKEIHITSDVVYGVWHYHKMTDDQDFMDEMGYEIVLEAARFWASRVEWDEDMEKYRITDVIGPDEYKEEVDDNFYTNLTADWTVELADMYLAEIEKERPGVLAALEKKIPLDALRKELSRVKGRIHVPKPQEDGIIPQDSTYRDLPEIDLSPYKEAKTVATILDAYNMEEINRLKVSKQADVMVAFLLFKNLYDEKIKKANFDYYESFCLHDSSLSLSTYAIMAKETGDISRAYELFRKSCQIDFGDNMASSDEGVHSASLGGIWQSVIMGFAGVRHDGKILHIDPALPGDWEKISFNLHHKGRQLEIDISHDRLRITDHSGHGAMTLMIEGERERLEGVLEIERL